MAEEHPPRARVFDMEADTLFRATLDSIRARPRLEVINVDPEAACIQVRERRRFLGRARTHQVVIQEDEGCSRLHVGDGGASTRRPPGNDEIAAFLRILDGRFSPPAGDADPDLSH